MLHSMLLSYTRRIIMLYISWACCCSVDETRGTTMMPLLFLLLLFVLLLLLLIALRIYRGVWSTALVAAAYIRFPLQNPWPGAFFDVTRTTYLVLFIDDIGMYHTTSCVSSHNTSSREAIKLCIMDQKVHSSRTASPCFDHFLYHIIILSVVRVAAGSCSDCCRGVFFFSKILYGSPPDLVRNRFGFLFQHHV